LAIERFHDKLGHKIVASKLTQPSKALQSISYCDGSPVNARTTLVQQYEGHPACKKTGVGMLMVTI